MPPSSFELNSSKSGKEYLVTLINLFREPFKSTHTGSDYVFIAFTVGKPRYELLCKIRRFDHSTLTNHWSIFSTLSSNETEHDEIDGC